MATKPQTSNPAPPRTITATYPPGTMRFQLLGPPGPDMDFLLTTLLEREVVRVEIVGLPDRKTTTTVERDRAGSIVKSTQTEVDDD